MQMLLPVPLSPGTGGGVLGRPLPGLPQDAPAWSRRRPAVSLVTSRNALAEPASPALISLMKRALTASRQSADSVGASGLRHLSKSSPGLTSLDALVQLLLLPSRLEMEAAPCTGSAAQVRPAVSSTHAWSAVDQARIANDLSEVLRVRVASMAEASTHGQRVVASQPERAREAFASIQETGRDTLAQMRATVASLREDSPTQPQPVLAQIDRLLSRSSTPTTHLEVTGDPRLLPPGVELAGYRTVEHLLASLDDNSGVVVNVQVAFSADALSLTVAGPRSRQAGVSAALTAAAERVALYGGTLRSQVVDNRRITVAIFPLTSYAWTCSGEAAGRPRTILRPRSQSS
jgi:hypothetical protein